MTKNDQTQTETPDMTLQELVQDMQQYHAVNGAYRPEDVYRLIGDPRKAVGLAAVEMCAAENHASAVRSTEKRPTAWWQRKG